MDSGLGNKGGENNEERNAMRCKSENTERINGLANNEDSNISSKVAQNNPLKDYRNIGDIVQCATAGCTNTFQVRTTWHKYCPECRAKKDLPFAKRKGRK